MVSTLTSGARVLFDNGEHKCISFPYLVKGEGVQANQFLIIHGDHAAVLDPGGDLTYTPLIIELTQYVTSKHIKYVMASHQDPDIIASMPNWLRNTPAQIVASKLWARFLPHLASSWFTEHVGDLSERLIELPDEGGDIDLGGAIIKAVPGHFLHSVGNFQFYDTVSKILFSGDMGASIVSDAGEPVSDFEKHIPTMKGFHQRYMCSHKVIKLWANMVRGMDVSMLVPQHGQPFVGKEMIHRFLNWVSELECGIDLLTQKSYQLPA